MPAPLLSIVCKVVLFLAMNVAVADSVAAENSPRTSACCHRLAKAPAQQVHSEGCRCAAA
jgi:hypothetical protein